MNITYKIEITVSPNIIDNQKQPYHWVLLSSTGNNWCNESSGWAISANAAWNDAIHFYSSYKKNTPQ